LKDVLHPHFFYAQRMLTYPYLREEDQKKVIQPDKITFYDPTYEKWEGLLRKLSSTAKANKSKRFLLSQFYAGHGMVDGGEQVVLTDEFDERTKWYRFLPVEMMCRVYSLSNPNIFMLSSFACCREKYNPLIHVGQCRKQ